jgi:large subunit ribosomal protein L11
MKKKERDYLVKFSMFLRAGVVDSGPPLSTILGNFGVNTIGFCKELNEFTKKLPTYFLLEVIVIINNDRTYTFSINEPSVGFLLKLVSIKAPILKKGPGGIKTVFIKVIKLKDIYLITFFKYGNLHLKNLKSVYGTLLSSHYYVVY